MFPTCDEGMNNDQLVSALSSTEFSSPIHVTPLFRSLAAGIPSPKFSESVSWHLELLFAKRETSITPLLVHYQKWQVAN